MDSKSVTQAVKVARLIPDLIYMARVLTRLQLHFAHWVLSTPMLMAYVPMQEPVTINAQRYSATNYSRPI